MGTQGIMGMQPPDESTHQMSLIRLVYERNRVPSFTITHGVKAPLCIDMMLQGKIFSVHVKNFFKFFVYVINLTRNNILEFIFTNDCLLLYVMTHKDFLHALCFRLRILNI